MYFNKQCLLKSQSLYIYNIYLYIYHLILPKQVISVFYVQWAKWIMTNCDKTTIHYKKLELGTELSLRPLLYIYRYIYIYRERERERETYGRILALSSRVSMLWDSGLYFLIVLTFDTSLGSTAACIGGTSALLTLILAATEVVREVGKLRNALSFNSLSSTHINKKEETLWTLGILADQQHQYILAVRKLKGVFVSLVIYKVGEF